MAGPNLVMPALSGLYRLAGKNAPGLLKKFGGARGVQQVVGDVGTSLGLNVGLTALGQLTNPGGPKLDLGEIIQYGAVDALASGASLAGVRGLRGTKGLKRSIIKDPKTGKERVVKEIQRSRAEVPVNFLASTLGMSTLLNAKLSQEQGANQAQPRSVEAQQVQREVVNGDPGLAGAYFPFTNVQNTENGPTPQAQFEQMLKDAMGSRQNRGLNALEQLMVNENLAMQQNAQFDANARAIMGL